VAIVTRETERLVIEFQHQSPKWTKEFHLRSIIRFIPGGYELEVGRQHVEVVGGKGGSVP